MIEYIIGVLLIVIFMMFNKYKEQKNTIELLEYKLNELEHYQELFHIYF